eukprot:jgi/Mesvir1/14653/Mv26250-RA.1
MWVDKRFAIRAYDWVGRILAGDLTLCSEIAKRHDDLNDTRTTAVFRTVPATAPDAPLSRDKVAEAPRIQSCDVTKSNMRAIKESSAKPVPNRTYGVVCNAANRLVTGYVQTAAYRKAQGLTKKTQSTRDTFTDAMCGLSIFFHSQHSAQVLAGKDPEKTALAMVDALSPGLAKMGHYEEARKFRGPEFAAKNKRLMLENQAWNREKRIKE